MIPADVQIRHVQSSDTKASKVPARVSFHASLFTHPSCPVTRRAHTNM